MQVLKNHVVVYGKKTVEHLAVYVFAYEFEIAADIPKFSPYLEILRFAMVSANIDRQLLIAVVVYYTLIVH